MGFLINAHAVGKGSVLSLQSIVQKINTVSIEESIRRWSRMKWDFNRMKAFNMTNCVLMEGLPGLGNVGKISVDFLIDELKAEKVVDIFSHHLPNSVFVNENNLIELPKIEIYMKKIKNRNYLFLAGDVQPIEEVASYQFAEALLDFLQNQGVKEIVTLGGIGLDHVPKQPKIYVTGNSKQFLAKFKVLKVKSRVHGIVGPIVGISGILLGLAKKREINAAALLSETYAHPMFIGLKGAREMVKVLNRAYDFDISLKNMNKDIKSFERNIRDELANKKSPPRMLTKFRKHDVMNYIG